MQIRHLMYLIEIAKHQTLTGAARELGISQSALSQYLAGAEQELGYPLFFNHHRKLIPTPEGSIYLNAAQRIVQIRNHTYQKIDICSNPEGKSCITVGVSGYRFSRELARVIPEVYRKYPETEIRMKEGTSVELREYLKNGEVDLAVCSFGKEEVIPELFFEFSEEEIYLLVPRIYHISHPALENPDHPNLIRLECLKKIPFIMPGEKTAMYSTIRGLFQEAGYEPISVYQTSNIFAALELAQSGFGAAFHFAAFCGQVDRKACQIYAFASHPSICYGIAVRREHGMNETERFLIASFLRQQIREKNPYLTFNSNSRVLLEEMGREDHA